MKWLQKLFCAHQWKKIYAHSSFSCFDQSGFVEMGEECNKCLKSRGHVIIYGPDGRKEREYFQYRADSRKEE
jgi:hypothetical protein